MFIVVYHYGLKKKKGQKTTNQPKTTKHKTHWKKLLENIQLEILEMKSTCYSYNLCGLG